MRVYRSSPISMDPLMADTQDCVFDAFHAGAAMYSTEVMVTLRMDEMFRIHRSEEMDWSKSRSPSR